ncbi:MAG: hypothetical protein IKN35_02915, partial [Lachnospiraceae bacterium]|nr:hypothetical protein [Lachnospiraceae bacterium]
MSLSLGEWINNNFDLIFVMVILGYTILSNRKMYRTTRSKFFVLIILVVTEAVFSQIEKYYASLPERTVMRYMLSTA